MDPLVFISNIASELNKRNQECLSYKNLKIIHNILPWKYRNLYIELERNKDDLDQSIEIIYKIYAKVLTDGLNNYSEQNPRVIRLLMSISGEIDFPVPSKVVESVVAASRSNSSDPKILKANIQLAKKLRETTFAGKFELKVLVPQAFTSTASLTIEKDIGSDWSYVISNEPIENEKGFYIDRMTSKLVINCNSPNVFIYETANSSEDTLIYVETSTEVPLEVGMSFKIKDNLIAVKEMTASSLCLNIEDQNEEVKDYEINSKSVIGCNLTADIVLRDLEESQLEVYFKKNSWYIKNNRLRSPLKKALHLVGRQFSDSKSVQLLTMLKFFVVGYTFEMILQTEV
jgi:hypothetical protein